MHGTNNGTNDVNVSLNYYFNLVNVSYFTNLSLPYLTYRLQITHHLDLDALESDDS